MGRHWPCGDEMNSSTDDVDECRVRRLWEEIARWKELKRKGILLIKFESGKIVYIEAQLPIK
jgi:hypothetical protein